MAEEIVSDVPVIVSSALHSEKTLPFSFLETHLYDRLSQLLVRYMPASDVLYVISEIKNDLYRGFTNLQAKDLHTLIHHCKKCPNVKSPVLPSWNCTDPDLLIVVENPYAIDKYGEYLFSALKQAGFTSQRCMLTHATRCKIYEITQQNVDSCVPYLHTELAITNPKLILTLGLTSFQNLTGDINSKLNEIKGTVRFWGTYSILPEISLGSLYHSKEKGEGAYEGFVASLEKAHDYLYSGGIK